MVLNRISDGLFLPAFGAVVVAATSNVTVLRNELVTTLVTFIFFLPVINQSYSTTARAKDVVLVVVLVAAGGNAIILE